MKSSLTPFKLSLVVIFSFVLASVINIYPLSLEASKFRPMALYMVLIFWLIYKPRQVGVGIAFIIGIIADLLLDTRLGQQAFAAVIMAFAVRSVGVYLRQLNLSIAWMIAVGGLILFQLTLWVIQYITQNIFMASGILALLVSIIIWPIVYMALIRFVK